ncbi:MAG: glycosyltransferase family 4 protein [Clostridia bacterium]|nr:glycosyltransferase family 4 protein [Clostridia bacterium]
MRILVVCQHYWPEPYYLADVCEELASRGHVVHVITDVPNYPMGLIYPDYRNGKQRHQIQNGVEITRTFTIGRRQNLLFRFLNYYSYSISSSLFVRTLKEEYDVVFTNQTSPIMMVNAAMVYAQKWHKKCVLYCMDLWPTSLAAGGVKQSSPLYKYFTKVSRKLYSKADKILISSGMFRQYLEDNFKIKEESIQLFPQYANDCFKTEAETETNKESIDLMFAGNIGAAQKLDVVIKAAKILSRDKRIRWHLVGDGSELNNLKKLAHDLSLDETVVFHGRKPLEEMPYYYSLADALLVSLIKDPLISMTLPGKVQTYMAAGKPIIAAANGEIPLVINDAKCGYCAPAEDVDGLVNAVTAFINDGKWDILGKNARNYFELHYTRDHFMNAMESILKEQASLSQTAAK